METTPTVRVSIARVASSPAPVYAVGVADPNRAATIRSEAAELQHHLSHRATEFADIPATRRSLIDLLAEHRTDLLHGPRPAGTHNPESEARETTRRAWFAIYRAMTDSELLMAAATA